MEATSPGENPRNPSLLSYTLQLFLAFPGYRGFVIPSASSTSSLEALPNGTCQENLQMEQCGKHPWIGCPDLPQMTSFKAEEQPLYTRTTLTFTPGWCSAAAFLLHPTITHKQDAHTLKHLHLRQIYVSKSSPTSPHFPSQPPQPPYKDILRGVFKEPESCKHPHLHRYSMYPYTCVKSV